MILHAEVTDYRVKRAFKTLEDRFRAVHGDKFDYSEFVYKTVHEKSTIKCHKGHTFEQAASGHYSGKGCPECAGSKKKTTSEFAVQARALHKGKYAYSRVVYVSAHKKVIITCKEHGDFTMTPHSHLYGQGCGMCGNKQRTLAKTKTKEQFVREATSIHGDKYNYSKVAYIGTTTKVDIICNECSSTFKQTPDSHLRGRGCSTCRKITTKQFITRARLVHGDKYDYTNTDYVGMREEVSIRCRDHGNFRQNAANHLRGSGCRKCSGFDGKTTTQFITAAIKVHGNKYDYSAVVYTGSKNEVKIRCKTCNTINVQVPNTHLSGKGCKICRACFKVQEPAILYYLSINNGQAYKIGITNKTVEKRFSARDLKTIKTLKTTQYAKGQEAYAKEQQILKEFNYAKWKGGDLLERGNTELFDRDVLLLDCD